MFLLYYIIYYLSLSFLSIKKAKEEKTVVGEITKTTHAYVSCSSWQNKITIRVINSVKFNIVRYRLP